MRVSLRPFRGHTTSTARVPDALQHGLVQCVRLAADVGTPLVLVLPQLEVGGYLGFSLGEDDGLEREDRRHRGRAPRGRVQPLLAPRAVTAVHVLERLLDQAAEPLRHAAN